MLLRGGRKEGGRLIETDGIWRGWEKGPNTGKKGVEPYIHHFPILTVGSSKRSNRVISENKSWRVEG